MVDVLITISGFLLVIALFTSLTSIKLNLELIEKQLKTQTELQISQYLLNKGWNEKNGMWSNTIHQNWKIEEAYSIEKSGNRF